MELDTEIDRLYGVPLDEFVSRRDALAKQLRSEGEREAADRVKALRKPTAGAWALNQAVRRRRTETAELLEAGERLRAAHEGLLSGGDRVALRSAMEQERTVAAGLADCAEAIASETGKSGPALRERVRSTLHAAALDEGVRDQLAAGRLMREHEAVGLGDLGSAPVPARRRAAVREGPGSAQTGATTSAGRDRSARDRSPAPKKIERAAEARARERAAALAAAERSLEEAGAALEEAQSAHDDAAANVKGAREALRQAEAAEREARKLLRERERERAKRGREADRIRP